MGSYKPSVVWNPPSNHQHWQISSVVKNPICHVTGREYQMRGQRTQIIDNNQLNQQQTCEDRRETELTGISCATNEVS